MSITNVFGQIYALKQRVQRKCGANVLGFAPGEMDVQMLSLMGAELPAVPITADIVEGSSKLIDHFKGNTVI